jgi:hypothetical protein
MNEEAIEMICESRKRQLDRAGTMKTTMKAIRIHRRGGPEALVYEDAPIPELQPGDALVRVHAAGISPAEFTWHIWEMPDGRSRLPFIPSHEVSGVVAAFAPDVRDVEVGGAVYGLTDSFRDGAAAQYVAVRAADLAPKPRSLDHASAAATPLSALTAWQALFDHARLTPGQRVLIHGAAGGVGSFATQLARWRGAHVMGLPPPATLTFAQARRGRCHRLWRNAVRDRSAGCRRGSRHDRRHDYGEVLVRPAAERAARHHRQAAIAGVDGRSRGDRIVLHRRTGPHTIERAFSPDRRRHDPTDCRSGPAAQPGTRGL